MSLPTGWTLASLGELVTLQTGPFGSSLHQYDYVTGGTPIVNPMHIRGGRIHPSAEHAVSTDTAERLSDFQLRRGDVVIGRRGEMGRCAVVTAREDGWLCGTGSMVIRCNAALQPEYLQRLLTTRESADFLGQESVGSTMANLNQKILLGLPVRLPPLAEQLHIVDSLDALDPSLEDAVAELVAAKRKLTLYRQSLLKSAVDGTLTANWRRGRLAQARTSKTIGEIADVGTGVTPLRSNARFFEGGTIPWVTSGALNEPLVTAAAESVTEEALKECRLKLYPPGTLLVAMYGEGKTRGKCAELVMEATINQAIAAIVLRPEYQNYRAFLKAFLWHSYETMRKQASGGVQPNLNLAIIKDIVVPLPPADEQREIVKRLDELLDAAEAQEEAADRALAMASAQRQNILRAAFSGQLVPQDPNDEPASVLLERIRAQRVASGDKPTARRPRKAKTAA